MSSTEQQELKEIRDMLAQHVADFRVFRAQLMGSDQDETAQGRIPRLEAGMAGFGKRLRRIEPTVLVLRGIYALVLAGGGYLLSHFLPFRGH